ncbi:MAG TPA: SDR family oxidoreductase [Acidimicrobiales bacterium]|jgi:putative NADH-flavin reductase|nr:SDR family oxidoreductase [Acidimicrobiales bacterium]
MRLAVFGANGPTGRLLTRLALDGGHEVRAFTRHPETFPIEHRRLQVVGGDVGDAAAVASAIEGTAAVVSTLGVPFAKTPITVYSEGAVNIIAGMHAGGVRRLVCVSSSALSPHPEPLGGFVFERIMQPYVVNKLGRTLYDDMRRMEAIVSGSDLDWTIVRPSGLFEARSVSAYQVALDHVGCRFTARVDLAHCLLRQAVEGTFVHAAIAVATPSAKPSMLKLIWQEGIQKKADTSARTPVGG